MFFSKFPKMLYDIDGKGNLKIVTDLLRRVKIRSSVRDSLSLFDKYDVQNGETPESLAYKIYGDAEYHYIILMLNNITDRYYGWPLSDYSFEVYVKNKYTNPGAVHHYESHNQVEHKQVMDLTIIHTKLKWTVMRQEQKR